MGVENLLSNPSGEVFEGVRRTELNRGHVRTPTFIVASSYLKEANQGLRIISNKLNRRGIAYVPTMNDIATLIPEEFESARVNLAAVVFAASALSIDNALIEKTFSVNEWIDRSREGLVGTIFPQFHVNPGPDITVPEPVWKSMIAVWKKDETISEMFTRNPQTGGYDNLPDFLKPVILSLEALPTIENRILPAYITHTSDLINARRRDEEARKRNEF